MKISEGESEHRVSAKDALITFVVIGVLIVLVWAGWEWYQQRKWVEQMEACNRLGSLCAADCPASRELVEELLVPGPVDAAAVYEAGCRRGCNKAGLFCSGVFGLRPSALNP